MFHLVYSVNAAPSPVYCYLAVPPPSSQVIHSDLAHYNLVAECDPETGRPTLVGVIDFGDVAEGWVMAELSTAIAALLAREDLSALEQVSEAKPAGGGEHLHILFHGKRPACVSPMIHLNTHHLTFASLRSLSSAFSSTLGMRGPFWIPLPSAHNGRGRGGGLVAPRGGTCVRVGGQRLQSDTDRSGEQVGAARQSIGLGEQVGAARQSIGLGNRSVQRVSP